MNTPQENTAVVRMMGDFQEFISKSKMARKPIAPVQALSFEQSILSSDDSMDFGSRKIMDLVQDGQKWADRGLIVSLESKVSALEMKSKQKQVEQEKERELLRQEREWQNQQLKDVQEQLQFLVQQEKAAKEMAEESKKEVETLHNNYEQKLVALQREKLNLESEISESRGMNRNAISSLQNELINAKKEQSLLENDLEEVKSQLKLTRRRWHDAQCQIKELEQAHSKALKLKLKVKELEQKLSDSEEAVVIAKTMTNQLSKFQEYEKENKMLKELNNYYSETNENCLLLKEKMENSQNKLERAEQRLAEMDKLYVENENLKSILKNWEVIDASGVTKYQTASDVMQQIVELQQKEALLMNGKGILESKLRHFELALKLSEEKVENLTKDLIQEKGNITHNADLIRRLQRKLLLVSKERDGYRKILDSYENQVTMDFSNSLRLRINELESSLEGYRTQLENLESDLASTKNENSKLKISSAQSQATQKLLGSSIPSEADALKIKELSDRVNELQTKYAEVLEEKFVLESRIEQRSLQGDYDPTKLKVVHFSMNPENMAIKQRAEEINRLQKENESFRQRIKLLEESGGKSAGDNSDKFQINEASTSKEVKTIKAQLSSAELKNQRLLEAFKKTSQEFREVVYMLLGYKIDIPTSSQYKLLSMYAESADDYLRFQQGPNGEMQLLETNFSSSLEDLIETYLRKQDSIPAFLSNLTLDLFNKQTRYL